MALVLMMRAALVPESKIKTLDASVSLAIQKEITERAQALFTSNDKLFELEDARVVVVCQDITGSDEARRVAERIASEVSAPSSLFRGRAITVNTGAVLAGGAHAAPDDVLADAEMAMRSAGEAADTHVVLFDTPAVTGVISSLDRLGRAPDDDAVGGFHLDFQPMLTAEDRSLRGVEALLRWEGSAPARTSSRDLVHLAEQSDWIEPLGRWVLKQAVSQTKDWTRVGSSGFTTFVNVSTIQLASPRFAHDVVATIRSAGVAPTSLGLDIMETALESEDTLHSLHVLRDFGVQVALDDFGMELSTMSYRAGLPLDHAKVDMSIVDRLDLGTARSVLRAIVSHARDLGLSVIAKRVQTEAHLVAAIDVGCDHLQGFLLSPPLSGSALNAYVALQHHAP
jgi:EAL domain-containing protein (putative c-di-GMP-specific phosphodiesterase class I)